MGAWSTLFVGDGSVSSSSSDSSLKTPTRSSPNVEDTLKCYICDGYFTKPRILPCGHTYCAACLLRLRENAVHEFNKTRDQNAHRRGECGFFTCPWPNCHYSMKIMNVWRWTLRNKAMTQAVAVLKKREKETTSTQTDTPWTDLVLTVPRKVVRPLFIRDDKIVPQTPTETAVQHVIQNSASIECLDKQYCRLPGDKNGEKTWKSYAFMFGMVVVDQVLRIGSSSF